jgi:beta-galactosidase
VIQQDFKKLTEIAGSYYQAKVALIKDYDNLWDGEQDKWHGPIDEFSDNGWFTAAELMHTPLDFLYLQNNTKKTSLEELSQYALLIYPHATILTEETAKLLKAYVEQGGVLIMGARTGYKDQYGRCPMQPMPGYAADICGVKVVDYTHLGPNDDEQYAIWDNEEIETPVFNDILEALEGANVLATFKGNYYDGAPALVANKVGKGTAYYYGAGFSAKTAEVFLRKLGFASPYSNMIDLPKEAELAVRTKDNQQYLFVLNYMAYDIEIHIKQPMMELLSSNTVDGKTKLEKYGVMVLKRLI